MWGRRALSALVAVLILALGVFIVFRPGDQDSAGVDLGDPHAWVEHGLEGELLQINSTTGEVTARIEVATPGESFTAVAHGDGAVLLNSDTDAVSLVSGSLLSVSSQIALGDEEDETAVAGPTSQLFGSPDVEGNVVVVADDQLVTVDPQSEVQTPIVLSAPLLSVVQDIDGAVVALPADADEVLRLGPQGLAGLMPLSDPVSDDSDSARSLVRAGAGTFMVDPVRLSISEVFADGTLGLPFCTTSAASGALTGGSGPNDEPVVVAFNPDSYLLNVSRPGGSCSDIDVDIEGDEFGSPVATGGMVYLPNWTNGQIIVVDIEAEEMIASYPFGTRGVPFELEVFDGTVWANEQQGPFAAIVDSESIIPVAKIDTIVAGASEIEGEGEGNAIVGAAVDGGGLRVIGDSGEEVIASGIDAPAGGDGPGSGEETGDLFGAAEPADFEEPLAVGIAIDALTAAAEAEPLAESEPADGDDPDAVEETVAEVAETLVANFSVSAGSATVGEALRFIDASDGSPTSWTWDFGDGTGAQEPTVEKSWTEPGTFVVTMTVADALGAESSRAVEISIVSEEVLLQPTADFIFDRGTIEAGERVSFTSRSTGEVDLLEWDFGDGATSVGESAQRTFESPGEYTVTLTASNAAGASTSSTTITVLSGVEPPRAAIAPVAGGVVTGQFVTLTSASLNEPTRLSWDLGDGSSGSGASVRHAWDSPGTYRVRLNVENSAGTDATFIDVTVNQRIDPPVSQFTQSATEVNVGELVTFTNLSLNDPTRLTWDFGDDSFANGETATKQWNTPGRYRVTLRATNDAGTNRTGVTIQVVQPVDLPVASFLAGATNVRTDTRVSFEDTSTNGPTSWSWDFGDTGVSNNPNTSHEWAKPGTYTVRLTVTNEAGSSSFERQIVVADPPSANFRWEIVEGTTVKFTDTSWDGPEQWRWDFGDGNSSTDRSPTHEFAGGVFDVTLVVSNDVGTSAPRTIQVETLRAPVARPVCEADGALLRCSGNTSARAASFRWSAPDATTNSTPNQASTVFTFPTAGRKDITLTVTNAAGVSNSETIRAPRVARGQAPRVGRVNVAGTDGALVRLEATFDRNPETWSWSVDGAQLVEGGNTATPLFRVPANGIYSGQVVVANAFGDDTDNFSFNFVGFETVAAFTWQVVRPGEVRFRNTSQAAAGVEYEWRFPGSTEIRDDNPAGPLVRYPDGGGTFRVVLIAEDANGRSVLREDIEVPSIEPEDAEQ